MRRALLIALTIALLPTFAAEAAVPLFDGKARTTERLAMSDPAKVAIAVSQARFAPDAAQHAVIARADEFADALTGTALLGGGPMLFTPSTHLDATVRGELERVVPDGARVFLLGGEVALAPAVANELASAGYHVRRLDGPTRIETAIAVAKQVLRINPAMKVGAMARAYGYPSDITAAWADSVTGGAWAAREGSPILLTHSEVMHTAVKTFLRNWQPERMYVLGGEHAMFPVIVQRTPNAQRVGGETRHETAAAVATEMWGVEPSGRRRFLILNAYHGNGWAFGLAAAGIAADAASPTLIVHPAEVPAATRALVSTPCEQAPKVDLLIIGNESIVPAAIVQQLDAVDRRCPPS